MVRRARLFRLIRTLCLSCLVVSVSIGAFMNMWWLFDCHYCVGHECGRSACHQYRDTCSDLCYYRNLIHDKPISFKNESNSSSAAEHQTYWQKLSVRKYDHPIYVYSAFYSVRDNHVMIIGKAHYKNVKDYDKYNDFKCVLLNGNRDPIDTTDAKFIKFEEHFQNYETTRITCKLSNLLAIRPDSVKLVHKTQENVMSEPIEVLYHEETQENIQPDIVVCVRPLFSYSSVRDLLEFIAYYRINEVTKFVFYKESVSEDVLRLFETMSEFVEILPWTLREGRMDETHENQIAATDDCLHRFRSSVILFIDIDEFIVPFSHQTLRDLIVGELKNDKTIALSVNNVFFCCEFNKKTVKHFPRVLNQFNRQSTVWSKDKRSKVIALKPRLIDRMGIHEVIASVPSASLSDVKYTESDSVLMFHYRTCCRAGRTPILWSAMSFRTLNDDIRYDDRIDRFRDQIIKFIDNYIKF